MTVLREYHCPKCGTEFPVHQGVDDEKLVYCPLCEDAQMTCLENGKPCEKEAS